MQYNINVFVTFLKIGQKYDPKKLSVGFEILKMLKIVHSRFSEQGIEDYLGDMDFKLAGTNKGITALQVLASSL